MAGLLRIPAQLPKTTQEWEQFVRVLNENIQYVEGRVVMAAATTIASRTGTDLDTVLGYLTDAGLVSSQRALPQVQTGNVSSTQDIGPVSAEATVVDADISIASFTAQYGFGQVAYNSGDISGVDSEENLFIYCDDPNYLGGAVSYSATTDRQQLTAEDGRVFVGAVRTTVALSAANITAATTANPIAFTTSAAHGWNTGNTVTFTGLPGGFGTALNGTGVYTITRTGASTFTVAVDGSAFAAYTTGGVASRQDATAISGQGGPSGWIDQAFQIQF